MPARSRRLGPPPIPPEVRDRLVRLLQQTRHALLQPPVLLQLEGAFRSLEESVGALLERGPTDPEGLRSAREGLFALEEAARYFLEGLRTGGSAAPGAGSLRTIPLEPDGGTPRDARGTVRPPPTAGRPPRARRAPSARARRARAASARRRAP